MHFIVATVFIKAQGWKQPKCPQIGDCLMKYIIRMEYYTATKKIESSLGLL